MSCWYVEKTGQKLGPFTALQLKELASTGHLNPDDLVRKDNGTKAVPASEVRGLFPSLDEGDAHVGPPAPARTEPPPFPANEHCRDAFGEGWKGLTLASRAAAGLAAAKARKIRLEKVELPASYGAIGREIYASARFRNEFPKLHAGIDEAVRRVERATLVPLPHGQAKGLTHRVAEAASFVKLTVQTKALVMKQESLLRRLGESAYGRHRDESGPKHLVRPIAEALSTIESLDDEIRRLAEVGHGTWITPGRVILGTASLGGVLLMLYLWATVGSTGQDLSGTADSLVAGSVGVTRPESFGETVPDFSNVDYGYDFSKDNYKSVPAGSTIRTRSGRIDPSQLDQRDKVDPDLVGKLFDEEGYTDAQGHFTRQGQRIVWLDDDRREKYCEDMWLGGVRHGPMRRWRTGGKQEVEATFVNGEPNGPVRCWYESGKASLQAAYLHGKQHGLRIEWFPNGQKELEVAYANDLRQGPMRAWYEDGKPREESLLVDDEYEGLAKVWGPQSERPDELHYRAGKLHGIVIRHTRDGLTTSKATYRDGVLVAPGRDVSQLSVSDFLRLMEEGSVRTLKNSRSMGSIWWEDAWFEMFGRPQRGDGTYKWSYTCLDGVVNLIGRPLQEGEGQDGQIWVSIAKSVD